MSLVPFLYYTLVKRASERKKINHVSRNATSPRALTRENDAAKRRRRLAGWIADGPGGEGFGPGSLVESGPAEVKRTRLVFSTRGRLRNLSG
jgi:hypothetical protein